MYLMDTPAAALIDFPEDRLEGPSAAPVGEELQGMGWTGKDQLNQLDFGPQGYPMTADDISAACTRYPSIQSTLDDLELPGSLGSGLEASRGGLRHLDFSAWSTDLNGSQAAAAPWGFPQAAPDPSPHPKQGVQPVPHACQGPRHQPPHPTQPATHTITIGKSQLLGMTAAPSLDTAGGHAQRSAAQHLKQEEVGRYPQQAPAPRGAQQQPPSAGPQQSPLPALKGAYSLRRTSSRAPQNVTDRSVHAHDPASYSGRQAVSSPVRPSPHMVRSEVPRKKAGRPIAYTGDPDDPRLTLKQRRKIRRRVANRESAQRVRRRRSEASGKFARQMESLQEANEKLEETIEQSQAMQKQLQQDLQDSQRRQDETTADNERASRRIARHQSREAAAQATQCPEAPAPNPTEHAPRGRSPVFDIHDFDDIMRVPGQPGTLRGVLPDPKWGLPPDYHTQNLSWPPTPMPTCSCPDASTSARMPEA